MRLRKWDPVLEFDDLFSRLGTLIGREPSLTNGGNWLPRTDISEDEKTYQLHIELPEVKKENIRVSMEHEMLTVTGERSQEQTDTKHHLTERFFGQFSRSFRLPDNIDGNNVHAEFKEGMLYLTIPKTESSSDQPHLIDIH
jgi:HSP20 family protein